LALLLATPPSGAFELLAQALSDISTAPGAPEVLVDVTDPSRLGAALAHPVYTLSGTQITQGRNVRASRLVAWRFLIQFGSRVIGAAELACDPLGRNLQFSSFDTGPFAKATRDAVAAAERRDEVVAHPYELRVLRAPSVYAMAVWLEDLDGTDDILIPLEPPRGRGAPSRSALGGQDPLRPAAEVVRGLRPEARTALDFHRRPTSDDAD
jgi:hypothetical protein